MKLALYALVAVGVALGAAGPAAAAPYLSPLSTSDVDPAVLDGPGCYLHQGETILLIGVKRNALLRLNDDLMLLSRAGDGNVAAGAGYRGSGIAIEIAVDPAAAQEIRQADRIDRPADVTIRRSKQEVAIKARWNCRA